LARRGGCDKGESEGVAGLRAEMVKGAGELNWRENPTPWGLIQEPELYDYDEV